MAEEIEEGRRPRKLSKDLSTKPGTVIITIADGKKGAMEFDFKKLPGNIQTNLGPFGLGHKLGDAAAGKAGEDAEKAVSTVWEGLKKGDWSVRAPAAPKISTKEISANYAKLAPKERETAKKLLTSLGISIPGIE